MPTKRSATPDLTICTVSFGHAPHLNMNEALVRRLNHVDAMNIEWLVAENAPVGSRDRLKGCERGFIHYPGSQDASLGASHHHATALNALIRRVRSRFLLVLDPDFYILRSGWVREVLKHIDENDLSFFGAPWHPRYVQNYRYFPAVHCMFVDGARIPLEQLDFRPKLDDETKAVDGRQGPLNRLREITRRRGQPWDTGTRVYEAYFRQPGIREECLVPRYQISDHWLGKGSPLTTRNRIIEWFLPDALCFLPKKRGSYTTQQFVVAGKPLEDLPNLWEQTFWRGEPFGLHVRKSFSAVTRNATQEVELCRRIIRRFVAANFGSAPIRDTAERNLDQAPGLPASITAAEAGVEESVTT